MKNLKKLTLLHSNDMHGDFLAEDKSGKLTGGVSMLSGYIQKVRAEEENVLYAISGDMFRGSIIDSEFMGLSTIEIMNMAQLLGISQEQAAQNAPIKTLATSARDALDEYLSRMELVTCPEDLRWITLE